MHFPGSPSFTLSKYAFTSSAANFSFLASSSSSVKDFGLDSTSLVVGGFESEG